MRKIAISLAAVAATSTVAQAGEDGVEAANSMLEVANSVEEALTQGDVILDARYRYEFVDQDTKREAKASTLRTRLGYKTKPFHGVYGLIEGENITVVGSERYYDTLNGMSSYAKVADPATTEINRALIGITAVPNTEIKLGRQRVNMGSKRFIGSSNWRQNETTYDAYTLTNTSVPNTMLAYGFITNENNNLGDDASSGDINSAAHVVDVRYEGFKFSSITPYAYFIKVDDMPSLSNQTIGLYLKGKNKIAKDTYFLHDVEYAKQTDYDNNAGDFDLSYYRIEPGIKWKNIAFKVGYEVLEGDGTTGIITAFASNHNRNGWVDKFSSIPADGLEDMYAAIEYKIKDVHEYIDGTKIIAKYHQFEAENTSAEYGTEWDFKVSKPISDMYTASIYYETYNKDTFSKDTQKIIMQFEVKL